MNYLQPDKIVATIETLRQRIRERFPKSSLEEVCGNLLTIARESEAKTKWFGQPVVWLRFLCWFVSIGIVVGSVGTLALMHSEAAAPTQVVQDSETNEGLGLTEFIQVLEAAINDIVLIGAAIFFLITLETRYKRGRALDSIHELRSIAHIIDMHQLTKDPERIINKNYARTTNSPKEHMSKFQLRRYLDYCSELLSLTGKIAAVYVQEFNDSVALNSVNEVETLCTGLSRKIWQKVSILYEADEDDFNNDHEVPGDSPEADHEKSEEE